MQPLTWQETKKRLKSDLLRQRTSIQKIYVMPYYLIPPLRFAFGGESLNILIIGKY